MLATCGKLPSQPKVPFRSTHFFPFTGQGSLCAAGKARVPKLWVINPVNSRIRSTL